MGKGTSSKSARRIGLPNILGAQHDCLGKTTLQTCTVPLAWQDVDCHCVVAFAVVLRNASFGFTMVGQSSAVLQCHIGGQFLGTVPEAPVTTPVPGREGCAKAPESVAGEGRPSALRRTSTLSASEAPARTSRPLSDSNSRICRVGNTLSVAP